MKVADREYLLAVKDQDDREKGAELAETLSRFVNRYDSKVAVEAFIEEITCRTHRTLQQNIMGLFLQLVDSWAERDAEGQYDLRNEGTVKLATKLKEVTQDAYLPFV